MRTPVERTCAVCHSLFLTRAPAQQTCGQKCGGILSAATRRVNHPDFRKAVCSVRECDRATHGQGYCLMHLKRVRRNGTPAGVNKRRPSGMSVQDWYFSQVLKTDTCWVWQGTSMPKRGGYGVFYDANQGKKIRAHHYLVPLIPTDGAKMEYDHLCRNVLCVRPEHLELVTATENRLRQRQPKE